MSTYHPELCDGESFMEITEDEAAMLRCVVAVNRRYAGSVRRMERAAKVRYAHDMRAYSMRLSGLTYEAIAEAMGCSAAAVRNAVMRVESGRYADEPVGTGW